MSDEYLAGAPQPRGPIRHGQARKWLVFAAALAAYVVGIMHRTTLGVAGLEAADHFSTTPSVISSFVFLQLGTYALAQLPVGAMLDKSGPRALLTAGCLVMAFGTLLLSVNDTLAPAIVARVLVGLGDACMYVSILKLIPRWFSTKLAPLMAQVAAMLAVLGQLLAVFGVLPAIRSYGWQPALTGAALLGLTTSVTVLLAVRNSPGPAQTERRSPATRGWGNLLLVLRHPGTMMGFFIHFTAGFAMNTFVLMWGIPYLLGAQGLSQTAAAGVFTLITVAGVFMGPLIGIITGHYPRLRGTMALLVSWAGAICWTVILLIPGPSPLWLLLVLALVLAAGSPAATIGIDYPRTLLPPSNLGIGSGIVIMGAYLGSTIAILAIGASLWLQTGGTGIYTFAQWQLAMASQIPIYAIGIAGIHIGRRRIRRLSSTGQGPL